MESFPAPLLFCEATLLDSPWKEEGALKEPHSQTMMPYGKGSIRKGEDNMARAGREEREVEGGPTDRRRDPEEIWMMRRREEVEEKEKG